MLTKVEGSIVLCNLKRFGGDNGFKMTRTYWITEFSKTSGRCEDSFISAFNTLGLWVPGGLSVSYTIWDAIPQKLGEIPDTRSGAHLEAYNRS